MKLKILIFVILFYYIWITTAGKCNFDFFNKTYRHGSCYNHLTDSIIRGQLSLLEKDYPPTYKKLFELSDPYDPAQNWQYRWHDMSFYKGKYYLYFGVTPAIVLYTPYYLLTKSYMPDNFAALLFFFGGFLWCVALLVYLKRIYFRKVKEWMLLVGIALIAFCDLGGYMIRQVAVYQVAIASAFFFLMGAIYWFCTASINPRNNWWRLCLGSLFFGLAGGGRPHNLICGGLIVIIWIIRLVGEGIKEKKTVLTNPALYSVSIPFLICTILLGVYNYLRFESPFEFGLTYQHGGINYHAISFFNIRNILPNIYFIFFQPPKIDSIFPFVHLGASLPSYIPPPGYHLLENIAGIFPSVPFILILIICPIIYSYMKRYNNNDLIKENISFPKFEFLIIFLPGLINLLIDIPAGAATMRFLIDFITPIIISSIIIWFYFDSIILEKSKISFLFRLITTLIAAYSISVGTVYGFIGPDNILKEQNPSAYNKVKSIFEPVSYLLEIIIPSPEGTWDKIPKSKLILSAYASSVHSEGYKAENVFDNNFLTDWAPLGSNPVILTVRPNHPAIAKSLWLLSRKTSLYEGWKKLNIKFYLGNEFKLEKSFNFPNAHRERIQHVNFPAVATDKIELYFSDPVTLNLRGKYIHPSALSPGYSEILFEWIGCIKNQTQGFGSCMEV